MEGPDPSHLGPAKETNNICTVYSGSVPAYERSSEAKAYNDTMM